MIAAQVEIAKTVNSLDASGPFAHVVRTSGWHYDQHSCCLKASHERIQNLHTYTSKQKNNLYGSISCTFGKSNSYNTIERKPSVMHLANTVHIFAAKSNLLPHCTHIYTQMWKQKGTECSTCLLG